MWNEEKRKCYVHHDVAFKECDFGKSNVTEVEAEVTEQPAEVLKQEESESESSEHEEIPAAKPLQRSERVSIKNLFAMGLMSSAMLQPMLLTLQLRLTNQLPLNVL